MVPIGQQKLSSCFIIGLSAHASQATRNTGKSIADKNIANPTAMLLASCMMLDHLKWVWSGLSSEVHAQLTVSTRSHVIQGVLTILFSCDDDRLYDYASLLRNAVLTCMNETRVSVHVVLFRKYLILILPNREKTQPVILVSLDMESFIYSPFTILSSALHSRQ